MKKFRPLQESINIVVKMLNVATYYGDPDEIEYWTRRYNGYMKLAAQKGITVRGMQAIEEEVE
jgi:hypothetical protein